LQNKPTVAIWQHMKNISLTRRNFIQAAAGLTACAFVPSLASASLTPPSKDAIKQLHFYNTHTGEFLKTVYHEKGRYIPEALEQINYVLRDFRTGDVKPIDRELLDLLAGLHKRMGSSKPFEIISGYRSPKTNSTLHKNSQGVAAKSQHMEGKAIDIRLTDRLLRDLRNEAIAMQRGGVGYYPESNFVHVDTARIRTW